MAARPMTGGRRPTTGMRVATAGGGGTARGASFRQSTASGRRPGTSVGAASGGMQNLSSIRVSERPMTREGLGGARARTAGPGRAVFDESYFLGALRTRTNELVKEIAKIRRQIQGEERDHSSYVSYEKKAEVLAKDLKELQGELADFNIMNDKLHTNSNAAEILDDHDDLKAHNDREAAEIDSIFSERQKIEAQIKKIDAEISAERNAEELLVEEMADAQRRQYRKLKEHNETMAAQVAALQQELDGLNAKAEDMAEEVKANPIKDDAVALYGQIQGLEQKKAALQEELDSSKNESPEQQREKLLKQVKLDNQEITGMERKINEIQNELSAISVQMSELDEEESEEQDVKRAKYMALVKKEKEMDVFLDSFDADYGDELNRIDEAEKRVLQILQHTSRNMGRGEALPTQSEHRHLQSDLAFKEQEMMRSQQTTDSLVSEREKLQRDLTKVNNLEEKIGKELVVLREKIQTMEDGLIKYSDLDSLSTETEKHKQELANDKETLLTRRDAMKETMAKLAAEHARVEGELEANETHTTLVNLEKKWQHHEKSNFVMREFIASKEVDASYAHVAEACMKLVHDYNEVLKGK